MLSLFILVQDKSCGNDGVVFLYGSAGPVLIFVPLLHMKKSEQLCLPGWLSYAQMQELFLAKWKELLGWDALQAMFLHATCLQAMFWATEEAYGVIANKIYSVESRWEQLHVRFALMYWYTTYSEFNVLSHAGCWQLLLYFTAWTHLCQIHTILDNSSENWRIAVH